jgi:site-specific DNA-adenine methylase
VQGSLFGDDTAPAADESAFASTAVDRIRPPVKAHGGKYYLARRIVPILLSVRERITEYLEPCAFGASVFLAMPRFEREILGDVNPEVAALWTVLSRESLAGALADRVSQVSYTRATFEAAMADDGRTLIEQATRFLIRCRFSRGGLGKNFAWSERERGGQPGDVNAWETFREQELPKIISRARGVEVTVDPCWWTVWESREKIHRLVYCDPPYMPKTRAAKTAYGPYEMTPMQHFWLVAALRAHSGPAAISGYRCEEYDRWLGDWRRFDFDMPNNAGQSKRKQRRTESLWINW